MTDDTIYTLVPSLNSGCYALDDTAGQDLASGQMIAIKLGDTWMFLILQK